MTRIERVDIGNEVYHVINRANARVTIFDDQKDYLQFEEILFEGVEKFKMRLLAYSIMPNHWHLVLYPLNDGDLSKFMGWITNTHTRRWHTVKNTVGSGHLYQGRYKSFICQKDSHLLAVIRYVERNPKRAKLVKSVLNWRWSSAWVRMSGKENQKKLLAKWPIEIPDNYLKYLEEPQNESEVQAIRKSIDKNIPIGGTIWVGKIVKKYNLSQTLRGVGRPKK